MLAEPVNEIKNKHIYVNDEFRGWTEGHIPLRSIDVSTLEDLGFKLIMLIF